MALSSTDGMIRRLKKNWKRLHMAIYGVAVLVIIHLAWVAKSSYAEPVFFGAVVLLMLGYRVWKARLRLQKQVQKQLAFLIPGRA